eukprot:TRINITY_DN1979_c1_g1_i1.p1 TRINITY_DN1979_c1_g1~~TRINITY_DN1979_c1_g1_i1.p1  ORF type:complete len:534 (-),score=105.01 TRINITY_DN1979_c1_g1_i1:11-1612(-)
MEEPQQKRFRRVGKDFQGGEADGRIDNHLLANNDLDVELRRLVSSGKLEAAAVACESAIRENPGRPEPWFLRGFVHDVGHEHEHVASCMKVAVRLDPDRVDAWLFLAECAYRDGDFEAAFHAFDEICARDPDGAAAKQASADAALLARNLRCVLLPRSAWNDEVAQKLVRCAGDGGTGRINQARVEEACRFTGNHVEERPVFSLPRSTSPWPAIAVWDNALNDDLFQRVRESIDDLCVWRVKSPARLCTFWLARGEEPRTAAEVAGRALLRLLGHDEQDFVGMEWWCRNQSSQMGAHFHYDTALSVPGISHKEVEERTNYVRPAYASVLYLGDVGGPTVVLDQEANPGGGHVPSVPLAGYSVATKSNRWMAFPGELRHGGLSLGKSSSSAKEPRFVVLYNFWKSFAPGPPACQTPDFSNYLPVCPIAPTSSYLLKEGEAAKLMHSKVSAERVAPLVASSPEDLDHSVPVEELPYLLPMPGPSALSASSGAGVVRLEWAEAARSFLNRQQQQQEQHFCQMPSANLEERVDSCSK